MKTIIFFILLLIVASMFMATTTITFKPFSISFENPLRGIGFFIFAIGLVLMLTGYHVNGYKEGYKEGYKDSSKATMDILEQISNENQ